MKGRNGTRNCSCYPHVSSINIILCNCINRVANVSNRCTYSDTISISDESDDSDPIPAFWPWQNEKALFRMLRFQPSRIDVS